MLEKRLNRGRATLFYRLWPAENSRKLLVLCHGLASNGTRWREFAEATAGQRNWNLLCPDLRGHGKSAWRGRIHSEIWCDDLAELLDAEGFEQAVIGGHCLGANLALRFARRYPERTAGLVLVEPMLPPAMGRKMKLLRRCRYLLLLSSFAILGLNALGVSRRELPPLDLTELDKHTREQFRRLGPHAAIRKRYGRPSKDRLYMPTAAYLQALNEVLRPLGGLEDIQAPALALLSSGGLFGDIPITYRALAAMPAVKIVELDAMHWIPTEQPEAMVDAIGQWLGSVSG